MDDRIFLNKPEEELPENILRNRTFNPELKNLISRIEDNESVKPKKTAATRSSERDIVRSLHSVFYKIKYSAELRESSAPGVPAGFDFEREIDQKFLSELILSQLMEIGFEAGAILLFDFELHCFVPLASEKTGNNLFVAVDSQIYTSLLRNRNGFIMTSGEIRDDEYISKLFGDDENVSDTYFLFSSFLLDDIKKTFGLHESFISDRLSPVICLRAESMNVGVEDIFENIKRETDIYFILMHKFFIEKIKKISSKNYTDHNLANLFLKVYSSGEGISVCTIGLLRKKSAELIYIFIYLTEKIKKGLAGRGIIFRITPDTLLVFCKEEFSSELSGFMIDIELSAGSSFYMKKESPEELLRSDFIYKKYF